MPSQFPKLESMHCTEHVELLHVELLPSALSTTTHDALHAPQLFMSVRRSVSHPLIGFPSQFAKPGLHTQAELEQLCEAEQVELQAPQLEPSIRKSASHPLIGFPSQSPKPGWQVNPQVPAPEQVGSLLGRFGQTWRVLPQLPTVLICCSGEHLF
jgi:hypothetical protein